MRSAIAIAAILVLTASTTFAQEAQPSEQAAPFEHQGAAPSELSGQHPPIQIQPGTPPSSADAPNLPESAPVIGSEEQPAVKIESEEQAKTQFESAGFMEVSDLKQDDKGMWTATAMKDGKPVQLSMNDQGNIAVLN